MRPYQPSFQLTHRMTTLVADIAERLGAWKAANPGVLMPELRRGNCIRTLQASLAIEQSTLSMEQVTSVPACEPVLGSPKESQGACNAFAYEQIDGWQPHRLDDLLQARPLLMPGLVDRHGTVRDGDVGVWGGDSLLHMLPPVSQLSLTAQARVETKMQTRVEPQPRTPDRILALLSEQPGLMLADVAAAIGRARSTVQRAAARLQAEGRLRHVGPKKGGRWEVP